MDDSEEQKALTDAGGSDPSIAARLVDRADFTGQVISGLIFEGRSVQQSLFSGTLFRNCKFNDCNFARSDFEGAALESCEFLGCDFAVADFRSMEAVDTRFTNCSFREGSTRSCLFANCGFSDCSFELQSFEDNSLEHSIFLKCSFQRSTLLHCKFDAVRFQETDLSDCTSQFHLFTDCDFDDCGFNAEAVGVTYGLTYKNLDGIALVWRGSELEHGKGEELVRDLATTYEARNWPFATAILKMNFRLCAPVKAFDVLFKVLEGEAIASRLLKTDDLLFLSRVITRISDEGSMPFPSIAKGLETIIGAVDRQARNDSSALKQLFYTLKDVEHLELAAMARSIAPLEELSHTGAVKVSFVFEAEPPLSFSGWLSELHDDGFLSGDKPKFLESRTGSYIEILYLSIATLSGILICLGLLERIVERITYLRARSKVLFSPILPPAIRRRALQPIVAPSATVARELQNYLRLVSGPHGEKFISDLQKFTPRLTRIDIDTDDSSLVG